MKGKLLCGAAALLLAACGSVVNTPPSAIATPVSGGGKYQALDPMPLVLAAERQAQGKAKNVLTQGRVMALLYKEVVRGSCWDYLDVLYTRAGVPRQARKTVHKGTFARGPFADPSRLRSGDWIYHVNHNYRNNEHSGMFIGWVDRERRLGLTLSYGGEGRRDPARYKVYDLSSVYNIMRAE